MISYNKEKSETSVRWYRVRFLETEKEDQESSNEVYDQETVITIANIRKNLNMKGYLTKLLTTLTYLRNGDVS